MMQFPEPLRSTTKKLSIYACFLKCEVCLEFGFMDAECKSCSFGVSVLQQNSTPALKRNEADHSYITHTTG